MTKDNYSFAIDDKISTSDNLAAFEQLLEAMDAQLRAALSPYLAPLAAGQPVDTAAVWDALYAATEPADSPPSQPAEETGCAEGDV